MLFDNWVYTLIVAVQFQLIDVINNNRIDAKYRQMVSQSVLVHLPEILEE